MKGVVGNKYYLYAGDSFYGQKTKDGPSKPEYNLILFAKHFPMENLIRIYATNDLDPKQQGALVSSDFRFMRENSDRVEKLTHVEFDYSNESAIAVVYINPPVGLDQNKTFVIKSRYCTTCTKQANYYCQCKETFK